MYKCSFYNVYSSGEEEFKDVNLLQEEFGYEEFGDEEFSDESKSTVTDTDDENIESDKPDEEDENYEEFGLEIGDEFEDWDLVEKQVEIHATKLGFEIVKRRVGKDKHGEIKC